MPSRCIFFFSAFSAWSMLLSRTMICKGGLLVVSDEGRVDIRRVWGCPPCPAPVRRFRPESRQAAEIRRNSGRDRVIQDTDASKACIGGSRADSALMAILKI